MIDNLQSGWASLSLAKRFALVAAAIVIVFMAIIGSWVASRIQNGVTQNAAAAAALYMDSFVQPLVQEMAEGAPLKPESKEALLGLFEESALGRRLHTLKIWAKGGVIAFSNNAQLIGRQFDPEPGLKLAWSGQVSAEFDELSDAENVLERSSHVPLLELYVPIRANNSDNVIAVGEFYIEAEELERELNKAILQSWLLVGAVSFALFLALFGIVRRGSRTIDQQRSSLQDRVRQLSALLKQNRALKQRVEQAYRRTASINERLLHRLSADLHDGPAQFIGLALLRLDALRPFVEVPDPKSGGGENSSPDDRAAALEDLEMIRGSLNATLDELRQISTNLRLPEIDGMSAAETVALAVRNHERYTGSHVEAQIVDNNSVSVPYDIKVCLFRGVQEGLNNAFHHASGAGQTVLFRAKGDTLRLDISDDGPGIQNGNGNGNGESRKRGGLGLAGLRDRVETLGGRLSIESNGMTGTQLSIFFDLTDREAQDE